MQNLRYLFVSESEDFTVLKERLEASFESLSIDSVSSPKVGLDLYLKYDYALVAIKADFTQSEAYRDLSSFFRSKYAPITVYADYYDEKQQTCLFYFGAHNILPHDSSVDMMEAYFTAQFLHFHKNAQQASKQKTVSTPGDGIGVYPLTREVFINSVRVDLTVRQYDLMSYFFNNPGRIITHEELAIKVWKNKGVMPNTISAFVSKLRKLIGADPDNPVNSPAYIETVHKIGYRFIKGRLQ